MIGVRSVAIWTADRGAPKAELLPTTQRRRCSLLTRIIAEVVGDLARPSATGEPGLAIADAPLVCGTGFGEIATTAALLEQMHGEDGGLSPIRFAGSVHNTAIGQLAIAIGHRGRSTTVSAGTQTLSMALVEAVGLFADDTEEVTLVLADEPLPQPLQPPYDGLAVALHLVRVPAPTDLVLVGPQARESRAVLSVRVPAAIADNPCASAYRLVHAIRERQSGWLALEPDEIADGTPRRTALCVELRVPS